MVNDAAHDPILLHLAKLLDEHFLGNSVDGSLQIGKTQNTSAKEVKENHQLPAPLKELERAFHTFGRGFSRVRMGHTFP
jgi:hypothetical protein